MSTGRTPSSVNRPASAWFRTPFQPVPLEPLEPRLLLASDLAFENNLDFDLHSTYEDELPTLYVELNDNCDEGNRDEYGQLLPDYLPDAQAGDRILLNGDDGEVKLLDLSVSDAEQGDEVTVELVAGRCGAQRRRRRPPFACCSRTTRLRSCRARAFTLQSKCLGRAPAA